MSTIATWSQTFSCYLKAMMMSLLYLQRVDVLCIPTWSLSNWYGMSCNPNMFLKKVWHVS